MRIFLSYASEQKPDAEAIAFSLRSRGNHVFLDRDDLPEGASYDDRIAAAVERSDMMIFLVSPESVAQGRYSLTELRFARYKWRSPSGRVLPVLIKPTPVADVPSYLKAVNILEPQGNKAAEVAFALERLRGAERAIGVAGVTALAGVGFAAVAGLLPIFGDQSRWRWLERLMPGYTSLTIVLLLAVLFTGLYWCLGDRKWWKGGAIGLGALAAWIACLFVYFGLGEAIKVLEKPPAAEFSRILDALPAADAVALKADTDKVFAFIASWDTSAQGWARAVLLGISGLACFVPLFAVHALLDPAIRSLNRLILGAFLALSAGALGEGLTWLFMRSDKKFSNDTVLGFVEYVDITFALWYLPWLATIPAAFAYWLVRGQER